MPSRALLTFVALSLLAVPAAPRLGAAQNAPAATPSAPDLSSPEAAIRSFALAVNALDVNGANCLVGGKVDQALRDWAREARKSGESFQVVILSVQPQISGDTATALVSFELKSGARKQSLDETVELWKVGADWQLLPPTEEEFDRILQSRQKDPHLLTFLAALYIHPTVFTEARDAAREAACHSNLKQLALAALILTQDNNSKYALRADAWKGALMPYVKSESVFHCPTDQSGPIRYSFNAQLQGKSLAALRKPEVTVLIYEGKKGVLDFRHHGRATVALANGKVRSVTAAEARALRWAP
jgi:hypothetical protein